jgi:hypothetical protein
MPEDIQIRLVHVEFLRPGPPHNQLLSPLTPFLAISGDAGAGVVTVPYEHAEFERRLKELRYETGDSDDRQAMLHTMGGRNGRGSGLCAGPAGRPGRRYESVRNAYPSPRDAFCLRACPPAVRGCEGPYIGQYHDGELAFDPNASTCLRDEEHSNGLTGEGRGRSGRASCLSPVIRTTSRMTNIVGCCCRRSSLPISRPGRTRTISRRRS